MNRCQICPNNCILERNTICGRKPDINENVVETTAIAVDPIEKKPLYHFLPGSKTLSIGTLGCNLKCLNCQNHSIAQPTNPLSVPTKKVTPESIVNVAVENNLESISWTYNEPTIYPEWIINTAKIAQDYNIKTILVSNGYTSQKTLDDLINYVDAVNIDLKSSDDTFYREVCSGKIEPVLNSIRTYYENQIHTEVTTLVIPGYNDDLSSINNVVEIIKCISKKIVLHFSAFYPQFKLMNVPPTPDETVINACDIAKNNGLKYVYPGNTYPSLDDNTYCENCNEILIKREYYEVINNITSDKKCPNCGKYMENIIL